MSVELIGTRVENAGRSTVALARTLNLQAGSGIVIVSSYWDVHACSTSKDLASRVGGMSRLVLWDGGATTKAAWDSIEAMVDDPHVDIRFVGSPEGSGIFHPKVIGATDHDGRWNCALIGSANFTRAGREDNVELGVVVRDEPHMLEPLADWFEHLWESGTSHRDIDIEAGRDQSPNSDEQEARRRAFSKVRLADPVPAGDIERLTRDRAARWTPPPSLTACHDHPDSIRRYLDVVMGRVMRGAITAKTSQLGQRVYAGTKVERLHLEFDGSSSTVQLRIYPGDTLGQARPLYRDPPSVRSVLDLRTAGWILETNFHWGYREPGKAFSMPKPGMLTLDEYCQYWVDHIDDPTTRSTKPDRFDAYWEALEADRVVDPSHRAEFRRVFQTKPLDHAVPRPGIAARFEWALEEARDLDRDNQLENAVRTRANEMLLALGEPPLI